jgi:L-2-hydroxyglutarate oxidase LhgO
MLALEGDMASCGGMVVLGAPVEGGRCHADGITLAIGGAEPMELRARTVINSAGLYAPGLAARFEGLAPQHLPKGWFAKGHYYRLSGHAPFQHLIYPVPELGGLGVHLTLDLGGQAKFGPDVSWIDTIDYAFDESRFERFVAAIRTHYPGLDPAQIHPDYTGIRPKLAGPEMADADFRIEGQAVHGVPGLVNLFGIESPGLTACLAIGDYVARLVTR